LIAHLHGQTAHPVEVVGWEIAGVVHAVALKGLLTAVTPPGHKISVRAIFVGSPDEQLFVVAAKADQSLRLIRLRTDQAIDDIPTSRSPIDIIAKEDQSSVMTTAYCVANSQQGLKFVETAVNIAYRNR
jgi:hypothetical protein